MAPLLGPWLFIHMQSHNRHLARGGYSQTRFSHSATLDVEDEQVCCAPSILQLTGTVDGGRYLCSKDLKKKLSLGSSGKGVDPFGQS